MKKNWLKKEVRVPFLVEKAAPWDARNQKIETERQLQQMPQTPWQSEINYEQINKMYCLYLLLKRKELVKQRFWVRPIFTEEMRLLQGFSDNLIIEMMHRDEEKYFDFFRMHLQSLNELFTLIEPHITKQTVVRTPIPSRTRFEICIRYLATGDSFQSLSYAFRVTPNTISKIISETCQVIWDVLAEIVFPEPTEQLWYQKACDYEDLWDFPNCIGSINGKHVVLQAPYKSGSTYYNYKGQHSIVLLAITDANGLFTVVDIGAEGRRNDGGIFMHSDLGISLNNNEVSLPPSRQLEENGPNLPYVLVGDEAFALTNYMMRPYSRRNDLDLSEKVYNYRHCRARRSVECSFGVLAARWRVYRKPMETSVTTSVKVVQATVCLHNFLMAKDITRSLQKRQYSQLLPAERDAPAHALHDLHVQYVNINNATGIRDAFKQHFNTTGVIEQQWERALQNNF